jgi:hypothetical protein
MIVREGNLLLTSPNVLGVRMIPRSSSSSGWLEPAVTVDN